MISLSEQYSRKLSIRSEMSPLAKEKILLFIMDKKKSIVHY
jgi:hypothetical protein